MDIQNEVNKQAISSEVRFYKVEDIMEMTGWSESIVLKFFNAPVSCSRFWKS